MLPAEIFQKCSTRYANAFGGVAWLRFARQPDAVLRGVRTVDIYAFNREPRRKTRSHIGNEVRKGMAPAITNRNASAAVVSIFAVGRKITSGDHAVVAMVKRCFTHAVRGIGFSGGNRRWRAFASNYLPEASAIARDALAQVGSVNPCSVSALAGAEPMCAVAVAVWPWNGLMRTCHGPVIESLVC